MQDIEWSTSTSTVGSKNVPAVPGLPPVVDPCTGGDRFVDVAGDDVTLHGGGHRADVEAEAVVVVTLATADSPCR